MLTSGAGCGRKVVWGTGGKVPWETALIVGALGGIVATGIRPSAAAFAVVWLVCSSAVGATPVVAGGGVTGGSVRLSCGC